MSRALLTGVSPLIHHHVRTFIPASTPLHHYTTTTPPPTPTPTSPPVLRPHQVLTYRYEPHPHPINCTTLPPTKDYLADAFHPHHLKAKRKQQAFNPTILNWRVHCPVAASGKKVVRDWCSRRARTAFQHTLQHQLRLNLDGSPQQQEDGEGRAGGKSSPPSSISSSQSAERSEGGSSRQGLKGALLVILKTETALTASSEEVRRAVEWVVESVRREDRVREFGGGKAGKKGDAGRGEKRLGKGGGKGSRSFSGGKGMQGA
ncbi:hypothetical protein D0865_16164 [Hortaea werneckii]|uniref:Uncharacterized protein n=1 Tax=Hortaea werneckii TaxID=91943 RepID=A0A3M7AHI2_HORWE|nr:hypothetical protein D0865_16164 [Hortaea werneckii]